MRIFSTFDLESFLWGLVASAFIGLFIRVYYLRKEAKGFPAWVELRGKYRGYVARIILSRDPCSEYVRMRVTDDPTERIVIPLSGTTMVPGAPPWKKVKGEETEQIELLGAIYQVQFIQHGFSMEA